MRLKLSKKSVAGDDNFPLSTLYRFVMSAADGDDVVEIERRSTAPDADEMMNLQLSVALALACELAAVAVSRSRQLPDLLPAVRSDDLPTRIADVPGLLLRLLAAGAAVEGGGVHVGARGQTFMLS